MIEAIILGITHVGAMALGIYLSAQLMSGRLLQPRKYPVQAKPTFDPKIQAAQDQAAAWLKAHDITREQYVGDSTAGRIKVPDFSKDIERGKAGSFQAPIPTSPTGKPPKGNR